MLDIMRNCGLVLYCGLRLKRIACCLCKQPCWIFKYEIGDSVILQSVFFLQLYEVFTFLAERGGIAQVHAENGEIIAEVTINANTLTHTGLLLYCLLYSFFHFFTPLSLVSLSLWSVLLYCDLLLFISVQFTILVSPFCSVTPPRYCVYAILQTN